MNILLQHLPQLHLIAQPDPNEFMVLASRTSLGKSALAMQIVRGLLDSGSKVAMHYLEGETLPIIIRMASQKTKLNPLKLRELGKVKFEEFKAAAKHYCQFLDRSLFVSGEDKYTLSGMEAFTRDAERKAGKLDLIVVDYLQLVSVQGSKENRAAQLTQITRTIKGWTKKYNCPVLLLSQLGRKYEEEGRLPMLSDLREVGTLERDADRVVFIYLHKTNLKGEDQTDALNQEVHLIQAKMNGGPVGIIPAVFSKEITSFGNYK